MKNLYNPLARAIVAICLFFFLKILISYVALSSFAVLSVDAEFDHENVVTAYYSSGINDLGFRERHSKRSENYTKDKRQSQVIYLNNHVARKLRIDLGNKAGIVKLFEFKLSSRFGPDITFDQQQIYKQFVPNTAIESYALEADHLLVKINSSDPFLTFQGDLILENNFLGFFLPLIFALLFFVFSNHISLLNIDAIRDISSKKSSAGVNYDSLDGIRGLAALMILAVHTGVLDRGVYSVYGFFSVSAVFCWPHPLSDNRINHFPTSTCPPIY